MNKVLKANVMTLMTGFCLYIYVYFMKIFYEVEKINARKEIMNIRDYYLKIKYEIGLIYMNWNGRNS